MNVVGRRERQDLVDDAGPGEADHHGQPPGDRGGLVEADLLQPAHIPFDVRSTDAQRVQALIGAPGQEDLEVGAGVQARLTPVAAQVRGHCRVEKAVVGGGDG